MRVDSQSLMLLDVIVMMSCFDCEYIVCVRRVVLCFESVVHV